MRYERQPAEITDTELNKAFKHAQDEFPKEACGVFTRSSGYIACTNIDPEPEKNFRMKEYFQVAANRDDVIAIFHSHPDGIAEPTEADMAFQISTAFSWGIVALDKNREVIDCFFWGGKEIPPLLGRKYRSGTMDCYSIIKDAYMLWYGIKLPDFPRDADFWERGENLYSDNFGEAGFEMITPDKIMPGDVLLGSIRGRGIVNHGAIVLSEREILHHTINGLSRRDSFSRWFQHLNICLRHKDFKDNGGPPMPPKVE